MLLEFKIKNYKSFIEEATLSMIPAPKQKDLEYSILSSTIGTKEFKAIPTSVLYGPNASGKTNMIGAIETLVAIINRGNINDDLNVKGHNAAKDRLGLIPNNKLVEKEPVEFYISFLKNNKHFEYTLKLDLGLFLDIGYRRSVRYEKLVVNQDTIFTRENTKIKLEIDKKISNKILELLVENLNEEELFLANGFKNLISNNLYSEINEFLNEDLITVYRADDLKTYPISENKSNILRDKEVCAAAKKIGAFNSEIGYFSEDEQTPKKLTTFCKTNKDGVYAAIGSEVIESYGTVRFLNLYPLIKQTLENGGVLIVDEFDASIHPMVVLNILNVFHNDEINTKNAQLIFDTHNPIFLNSSVLRRDEIKFVERDENGSVIYSLADFKTSGEQGVRTSDDYMKHYFMNKYGAIIDVDLASLLKGERDEETPM